MMQKAFQRFTSLLLSLTMLLSLASTAFAVDGEVSTSAFTDAGIEEFVSLDFSLSEEENFEIELTTLSPKECAEAAYYGLSPTARDWFLAAISSNPELIEFHQRYVDSDFVPLDEPTPYIADPITLVSVGIGALALTTAATNGLTCLASQFLSTINSGEIEIGDFYSCSIIEDIASTLIDDWDYTRQKWNTIIDIFCDAFDSNQEYVSDDVDSYVSTSRINVRFGGNTVVINGIKYECTELAENHRGYNEKFYVAIRNNNVLYVCNQKPIPLAIANALIEYNSKYVGVFTIRESTAYALAGYLGHRVAGHNNIDKGPNFLPHYHRDALKLYHSHIWFLLGPIRSITDKRVQDCSCC